METPKTIFDEKKLGRSRDIRLLKRLYPYLAPYRHMLGFAAFLMVLITLLELSIPYVTKIAIDRYIVPGYTDLQKKPGKITHDRTAELPPKDLSRLQKHDLRGVSLAAALLVCIIFINFCLNFAQVMIMEYTGQRMMHDLRMKLFTHIQGLSARFFTKNPVGRLVTRVANDTQNMHDMFTSVIVFILKDLFLILGITVMLFSIDWRFSCAVYALFPFVVYAAFRFAGAAREAFRTLRIKVAEINTRFSETIGGIRVIQLFNREHSNFKRFKRVNHENYLAGMQQITVFALFMPFIELMSAIALAVVIFYGGGSFIARQISLGTLVLFIFYLRMFFRPMRDIAEKYNITLNALSSAERIFLILEDKDMLPSAENLPAPPVGKIKRLAFEHVTFSYLPGETVLNDITFTLRAGSTLALVGPTGAGKTTLANLILRFFDPVAGRILINGIDIRKIPIPVLRSKIGLVMQDPFLFSGSIRENITNGARRIDDAALDRIIDAAHCRSVISRLPGGIDLELSGGGSGLSSGQRQLICIARALATDPELILFDEATSYIDSETEKKIQSALFHLMKDRTTIIIAHRLSTARIADHILVMDNGKITETGTHDELIRKKGFYYRLNRIQG